MLVQQAKVGEDIVDCNGRETGQYTKTTESMTMGIGGRSRDAIHQLIIHIVIFVTPASVNESRQS